MIFSVVFFWTHSSVFIFLRKIRNVLRTLDVGLPVWRGRITSLHLLKTLLLTQPKMILVLSATRTHCWLIFNLISTRTPSSFSADLYSSHLAPQPALVHEVVPIHVKDLAFPLTNFMRFLLVQFSSLFRSL